MAMGAGCTLRDVYFGCSLEALLLRIDCDREAQRALLDFDALRVGFVIPEGLEIVIQHPGRADQQLHIQRQGKQIDSSTAAVQVGIDRIAEMAIPFALLGVEAQQPMCFFVELLEGSQSRDRAPREGVIQVTRPTADFERVMWDV